MLLASITILLAAVPVTIAQPVRSDTINPMCRVADGLVFPSGFNKTASERECSNNESILPVCKWAGLSYYPGTSFLVDAIGVISPSIGCLTGLRSLILSDTQLTGCIPSELGSPSDLGIINLRAFLTHLEVHAI